MSAVLQLANQYFLIWVPSLLLAGSALAMLFYRASRPWWIAWATGLLAASAVLFTLRTPAATLLHRSSSSADRRQPRQADQNVTTTQELIDLTSVEQIEQALLAPDGKPTL